MDMNVVNNNNFEDKIFEEDNNFINIKLENENDTNNNTRKSMHYINEQLEKIKNKTENNDNFKINKNFISDNENFIDYYGKNSTKKEQNLYNNMFENYINASNQNFNKFKTFPNNLPKIHNYKSKVIFIQRYFRKFLFQKEFYGKLGTKKVGFFLIKNIFLNKIGGYIFNILKIFYKYTKNDITQDDDFIQLDSERIEEVKQKYINACECINYK